MASQKLPQLPAFLTQPAICTNIFCRSIDRTLPSTPVEFETLLQNWFCVNLRDKNRFDAAQLALANADMINDYILQRVKLYPPKMLTAQLKIETEFRVRQTAEPDCPPEFFAAYFIALLTMLAWKTRTELGTRDRNSKLCLHDLLDASQQKMWQEITRIDATNRLRHDEYDPSGLFDRISTAIANGEIQHLERWGEAGEWQEDVLMLRAERLRWHRMGELLVKDLEGFFEKSGYSSILGRPGAIIAMLSEILPLLDDAHKSKDSNRMLREAPQFKQLIQFCESPLPLRQSTLAAFPPLNTTSGRTGGSTAGARSTPNVIHRPASPTSAAHSTPSSLHQLPSTTFDRFEKVKIVGGGQPSLNRLVQARMCPPDRCSGRLPDISKYEMVDKGIQDLFLLAMKRNSLSKVDQCREGLQTAILRDTTCYLHSLDSAGSARYDELEVFLDTACQHCDDPLEPLSGASAVDDAMSRMANSLLEANKNGASTKNSTSLPCLCDLTHLCPALEKIRLVELDLYKQEMRKLHKRALAEPYDRSDMYAMAERISSAGIATDCWTVDWKVKFDPIIDILRPLAVNRIFFEHELFTQGLARLSKLVSSTQIMEEVPLYPGGAPNPNVTVFAVGHYDKLNVKDAPADTSADVKELADRCATIPGTVVEGRISRPIESVRYYQWAILLDASNVSARLNAAANRLRFADDEGQYIQWTRAIYDCTAALYYGGPSFKAYYRRGYALAHLKMWDKAILDYKQALEIEPKNVRVEQCLIAARKRVAVR